MKGTSGPGDVTVSIDHLHEGVQVIDDEWRYVYVNPAAAGHGRRSPAELIGRTMMECFPGIDATPMFSALKRVMESGRTETLRNEFSFGGPETHWFDLVVDRVPAGICVISIDVTDRLRQEERQRHFHRMEALGQLAGGVAHDFNNQLTAILGFAELAAEESDAPRVRRALNEIREAALRSAGLTKRLLTFSRRQPLLVEPADINAVIERLQPLLTRVLGEDIQYLVRLTPERAVVRVDGHQLENAVTNLAINARDAMPQGGTLTITTDVVDFSDDDARQHEGMTSGRYAALSVIDTGQGMDRATQARLFEPFFTTKPPGKGTGFGLALVYGLVKQMKGFIWVYSEPGQGTTFRLYFPLTSEGEEMAPPPAPAPAPARREKSETILVVEDNAGVRHLIQQALVRAGYDVLVASDGDEAREQLQLRDRFPSLILVDVVLPKESGPDFVRSLELRPSGVVFMSGYSEVEIEQRGVGVGFRLLEKPFTARQLLDVVTEVLSP